MFFTSWPAKLISTRHLDRLTATKANGFTPHCYLCAVEIRMGGSSESLTDRPQKQTCNCAATERKHPRCWLLQAIEAILSPETQLHVDESVFMPSLSSARPLSTFVPRHRESPVPVQRSRGEREEKKSIKAEKASANIPELSQSSFFPFRFLTKSSAR